MLLALDWTVIASIFAAVQNFESPSERREFLKSLLLLKWISIVAYCLMEEKAELSTFVNVSLMIFAVDAVMGVAAAVVYFGGRVENRELMD